MTTWRPQHLAPMNMHSTSPANSTRRLTRPIKLALVSVALLSAATSAPVAIAHRGAHADGARRPARSAATHGFGHLLSRRYRSRAAAVAHEAVIGGTPAEDGTFASVAYIVDFQGKGVGQCTGTVVAPSLILTAGHCVENMKTGAVNKPSGYRVVTGDVDWVTAARRASTVLGVIVYPGYVRKVDYEDAALLVLSAPVTAPAIALATTSDIGRFQGGSAATMAGWGITSLEQRLPTERLRWADTVVQGHQWCKRNAPPFYEQGELCTITPRSYATGACGGDSGGPLLVPGPAGGEPVEVGIAIHVYGRCSTRRPSVFTRVDSISSWVHTWIEAYKRPPSPPAP